MRGVPAWDADILLQRLPEIGARLESFSLRTSMDVPLANPVDLSVFSSMTRLERVAIGCHRVPKIPLGRWSMEAPAASCHHLSRLRQLALVGAPEGHLDIWVLILHLTRLEHLRLRLNDFEGVTHVSVLTRLTLLQIMIHEPRVPAIGPPSFLSNLRGLRQLSLHWAQLEGNNENETICCLATLSELVRLRVRLLLPSQDPRMSAVSRTSTRAVKGTSGCPRIAGESDDHKRGGEEESYIWGQTFGLRHHGSRSVMRSVVDDSNLCLCKATRNMPRVIGIRALQPFSEAMVAAAT